MPIEVFDTPWFDQSVINWRSTIIYSARMQAFLSPSISPRRVPDFKPDLATLVGHDLLRVSGLRRRAKWMVKSEKIYEFTIALFPVFVAPPSTTFAFLIQTILDRIRSPTLRKRRADRNHSELQANERLSPPAH
jgi:hypothetical protein